MQEENPENKPKTCMLNVKVNKYELEQISINAVRWFNGNVSELVRFSAMSYRPAEEHDAEKK